MALMWFWLIVGAVSGLLVYIAVLAVHRGVKQKSSATDVAEGKRKRVQGGADNPQSSLGSKDDRKVRRRIIPAAEISPTESLKPPAAAGMGHGQRRRSDGAADGKQSTGGYTSTASSNTDDEDDHSAAAREPTIAGTVTGEAVQQKSENEGGNPFVPPKDDEWHTVRRRKRKSSAVNRPQLPTAAYG